MQKVKVEVIREPHHDSAVVHAFKIFVLDNVSMKGDNHQPLRSRYHDFQDYSIISICTIHDRVDFHLVFVPEDADMRL